MTTDRDLDIITILHISDFHYSKTKLRDQKIIVDALIRDVQEKCVGYRKPDILLFTGDLVQAAGIDRHDDAYDFMLSRVSNAVGLSDERVFIAPGNHDVETNVVDENLDAHKKWRNSTNEELNAHYDQGHFKEIISNKFKSYIELETYLGSNSKVYSNDFGSVHRIPDINIDILTFNTAAFSKGGSKNLDKDEGEMAIPEFAIIELTDRLSTNFCISVTHHPLQSMNEMTCRHLRQAIQSKSNIHLFGHMHDPNIENIQAINGSVHSSQSAAIFTNRTEYHCGYSIISYSRSAKTAETVLRKYYPERSVFDADIGRVNGGVFYPTEESRNYWRQQVSPFDGQDLKNHIKEVGPVEIFLNNQSAESEREVMDQFVAPPIVRQFFQSQPEDTQYNKNNQVDIDEIITDRSNEIIIAAPEHGRTIFLRHIQVKMCEKQGELPNLPIFIEFNDIKTNISSVIRLIRSNAISLPTGLSHESLMEVGHITILIDDVDFSSTQKMRLLKELMAKYPKCRYILSAPKKDILSAGNIALPELPLHFGTLEICALGRKEMRKLVKKLNPEANQEILLEKLHTEFTQMNLPFTAANGTILMDIYGSFPDFKAINRSVVIEQFIDASLRKAAEDQVRRETFDFNNKTSLLASVASWMSFKNNYKPNYEDLRKYVHDYLDELGLTASVDDLLQEFFAARIIVRRSEGRITFRYRSVLEYFISIQMTIDPTYKDWVLEEDRYLQYVNEIQFYAGKMRSDINLINLISERFIEIMKEAKNELPEFDLEKIAALSLPSGSNESSIESIADQLDMPPMSEEERDQEIEADLPKDVEDRQEVFRPQIADLGAKLLVSMALYSGTLKNLETIKDIDKRYHLSLILRGWSFFLGISLYIVPELAKKRKYKLNGVNYTVNAPLSMPNNDLSRLIALSLPTGISLLIKTSLGTEKLERQLCLPTVNEKSDPLVYDFFRVSLISDLRLRGTTPAIHEFLELSRKSDYFTEAMIWKIKETRIRNGFEENDFAKIIPVVSSAIANMKGGSKKVRDKEKVSQIQKFRKQSILIKMRRTQEDKAQ